MKKFYTDLGIVVACLIALSSCKSQYHFVTKNLPENDSSYIINTRGQRIDANNIVVKVNKLVVDKKKCTLDTIVVIKSKKRYFVINRGELYQTSVYGKVNLLYQISYSYYSGSGTAPGHTDTHKAYYLQKQGSKQIDELNKGVFYEYMADNPEALAAAKAHYIWSYVGWGTFAATLGSFANLTRSVTNDSTFGTLKTPIGLAVGAVVLSVVVDHLAEHKIQQAVLIYDTTEN